MASTQAQADGAPRRPGDGSTSTVARVAAVPEQARRGRRDHRGLRLDRLRRDRGVTWELRLPRPRRNARLRRRSSPDRHHRHGRRAAHDRGRVRPLGRLAGRRSRASSSAILVTEYGLPVWLAVLHLDGPHDLLGAVNGIIVVRTGLPSFIVTLATMLHPPRRHAGAHGRDHEHHVRPARPDARRRRSRRLAVQLVLSLVICDRPACSGVDASGGCSSRRWGRTSCAGPGSATGSPASAGRRVAARNLGVPVARVKIVLFMGTALGLRPVRRSRHDLRRRADVTRGRGKEFQAIITAVIGGTLLTGGYGSMVGIGVRRLHPGRHQPWIFYRGYQHRLVHRGPGRAAAHRGLSTLVLRRASVPRCARGARRAADTPPTDPDAAAAAVMPPTLRGATRRRSR